MPPDFEWIAAADTPWGVPVLDVRPVTQGMISTSQDPDCAANALSYTTEDGSSFAEAEPVLPRSIPCALQYKVEGNLPDGALFRPWEMEHKWAIFHRQGRILFVRGWTRQVHVISELSQHEGYVEITRINGVFTDPEENPADTIHVLDFLLRSHVLGVVYPAPLPAGMEENPMQAALWCFHMFGNLALCATNEPVPFQRPEQPLQVIP